MADRFRGARGPRRKTAWQQGPEAAGVIFSTTSSALWDATGSSMVSGREVTIVRTRGEVNIILNVCNASLGGFRGALGIAIATPEAIAVGITAVKTPLADVDWDGWLWHSMFDVHAITSTISDGVNSSAVQQRITIDSKAMRKISDEQVVFGAIEVVETAVCNMSVFANCRVLVKLA